MTKLRCTQREPLQWIQNALDEARNKYSHLGRPLTFEPHDGNYPSLLSNHLMTDAKSKDGDKKSVSLNGILNLLIILMAITNVRNIVVSLEEHGNQLDKLFEGVQIKEYISDINNYYTPIGLSMLPFFTSNSFIIEVIASK